MARWSSGAGRFIPQFLTHSPHAYKRLETMELSPHSDLSSSKADVEAIEAAKLLDSVPARIILTAADNRRILRKIDLVILPILLTVYFLQALDKATLAYASV